MTPDHWFAAGTLLFIALALLVVNRLWLVWTGRVR